jgi:methyltransferase (TIGR00027 family)
MNIPSGSPLSQGAIAMAYAVATHQRDRILVFHDSLVGRMVGISQALVEASLPGGTDHWIGQRLVVALSHRFADDVIQSAIAAGVTQLVVLDAGLHTFCYRRPYPASVRLFEVDTPNTLRRKRQLLADAGVDIPATLTFVPLGDRDKLAESLAARSLDPHRSTLVVWLGTMFLDANAICATLHWMRDGHPGRPLEIVLDCLSPQQTLEPDVQPNMAALTIAMAQFGATFVSYCTPRAIDRKLRAAGFGEIENLSWADLKARYAPTLARMPDPMGVHIVHAKAE